jgi:hypothetical protein
MTESTAVDRQSIEAALTELDTEHHAIGRLLERLGQTHEPGRLGATFAELRALLSDHFAHEERPGGLYDRMGVVSATYRDRVRALVDDHFRILAQIRSLEKRSRETPAPSDLEQEARSVQALLREHEQREKELTQAAVAGASH